MNIETEITRIDTEVAKEFLLHPYDNGRALNTNQIKFLTDAMVKGRFSPTSQIAFANFNQTKYLVNGNHTLSAIIKSETSHDLIVANYHVDSMDDVASLFSHFDIGRGRTHYDSLSAFQIPSKFKLNKRQVNRASLAMRYMKAGMPLHNYQMKVANEDLIDYLAQWKNEIKLFFHIYDNVSDMADTSMKKRILSQPVMAVMLIILRYSPDDGKRFMSQVMADDGLRVGDPRKTLRNYLIKTATVTVYQDKVAHGILARAVAKSWNIWKSGKELKRMTILAKEKIDNIILADVGYITGIESSEKIDLFSANEDI